MPLGDDWFALGDTELQVHFDVHGQRAISVQISRAEGDGRPIPRSNPS